MTFEQLSSKVPGEASAVVRARVLAARSVAMLRQGSVNAQIEPARVRSSLKLSGAARQLLERAVDRFGFSARAHDRALRVALTIKDLADVAAGLASTSWPVELDEAQVGEALSYRQMDRSAVAVANAISVASHVSRA